MLMQLVTDGLLGKFLHANTISHRWALGEVFAYYMQLVPDGLLGVYSCITCFVTQQIFCCLFFVSGLREDIEGGTGGRIWKEELEGGFGRRTWKEELEGGFGRRTWKEDLEGGFGRRTWKEDLEGGFGRKTRREDLY
jgi:hypothetical protein